MATAFTKLRYDPCTYSVDLRQSLGPGQWTLDVPGQHCTPCLASDSRVAVGTNGGAVCATTPLVDVESDLHNLPRRATGCPAGQYQPTAPCASVPAPDCRTATHALPTIDTRLNNPPCTLRGTGWNRWEWLCQDPQDTALLPFDVGVDTALVAKDNHRPALPCPISAAPLLPPARHDAGAMATDAPPAWAQEILGRHARGGARVGDGVGADGATPILAFRDCPEVHALNVRVPA